MASATPTGPNTLLTRAIAGLSVVVALVGVIAIFTKDDDNSSPKGSPAPIESSPASTPTTTPSLTPSVTPSRTPSVRPSPRVTATATATAGASVSASRTSAPATSPTPTASHPHSAPPSGGNGQSLSAPSPGSYPYATTGTEQTNIPGTARHYPATTTVTINRSGCGVNQTWTPISQHSETQHLCIVNNAVHLLSYRTTISFFGQTITQQFKCASNAFIYSPTLRPGHTWSFTCTSNGSKITQHLKAIGFETVTVNGTPVHTLHIRASSAISGSDSGTSLQNYWIETGSHPFEIRNTAKVTAKMGGITYSESYAIQLKRL